jgi:hypothetical protein
MFCSGPRRGYQALRPTHSPTAADAALGIEANTMHRARKLAKRAIGSFTELVADLPLVVLAWGPDFSVVTVVWSPWLSKRAAGAETGAAGRTGQIGVGRSQSPDRKADQYRSETASPELMFRPG